MMKMFIPSIEEQKKIVLVLNSCDREIEILKQKLNKLNEQKKGLMQKLLTGQVRVKLNKEVG
jgi:type I restriction enzyme S subunit